MCRANVCRSPAGQFLLAEALRKAGIGWSVSSAGTITLHTLPGMCSISAHGLEKTDGGTEYAERHTPRQVTTSLLDAADLVLTASRDERSAVARLSPTARTKTFTLVEAATLATHAERARPRVKVTDAASFARVLHEQRGRAIAPKRGRWGRHKRHSDGDARLDVPDAHAADGPSHDVVLARIRGAVDHLAEALTVLHRAEDGSTRGRTTST